MIEQQQTRLHRLSRILITHRPTYPPRRRYNTSPPSSSSSDQECLSRRCWKRNVVYNNRMLQKNLNIWGKVAEAASLIGRETF